MNREKIKLIVMNLEKVYNINRIEMLAKKSRFIKRQGTVSAKNFLNLCTFLGEDLCSSTLAELCAKLESNEKISISPQALSKRFSKESVNFLKKILHDMLNFQNEVLVSNEPLLKTHFNRILIVDSTSFKLADKHADDYKGSSGKSAVKIQMQYDLLTGEFIYFELEPASAADAKYIPTLENTIEKGDLSLKDLGYFKTENLKFIEQMEAFYISRLKVNTNLYRREEIIEHGFKGKVTIQRLNLGKIKKHGVAGVLDRRQSNGSHQEKKITKEIGQRILELRISNPSLSTRDISDKLREQDNLEISHTLVNEYINEIGLNDYRGTPFRGALFPPKEKNIDLVNSRYAGELMLLPAANKLGCMKAAEVLDVAKESDHYSNDLIYRANFLSIASGKERLSHVDELVESEFIEVCGGNFPKKSANHAYLDKIIEKDTELVTNGDESIIDKFVDKSTKGYCEAEIIVAENLYMDKHVVQVNTEKNVGKDMHGTKDMIVKALCEYWLVCADTKNPVYLKLYNSGEEAFSKIIKPILNKVKCLTGKNVQLLGLDRGAYNYAELKKATENGETCISIWGKDTPATLKSLSEISNDIFIPYETVEEEDEEKNKKIKVKSTIADAGEIIVDNDGNKVRAIVIQNEESKRRIPILVFGKRAVEYIKENIADFMYGKQDIENHFKERKKWGSDKFCGGKITLKKLEPPTEDQICKIEKRIIKIGNTLLGLKDKLSEYDTLLSEKKVNKTDYNQLVNRLNRREKKLGKEEKILNLRIGNNKDVQACKEAPVYEIDMRKMTILAQLQDHVIVSRKYIMNIFIGFIIMLISRNLEKTGKYTNEGITRKMNIYRNNINIQKLSLKLFEQGGGVYRDTLSQKYIVVMRNYNSIIMQEAYELLCQELLKLYTEIKVGGQGYQL